jgi:hypothetical protein
MSDDYSRIAAIQAQERANEDTRRLAAERERQEAAAREQARTEEARRQEMQRQEMSRQQALTRIEPVASPSSYTDDTWARDEAKRRQDDEDARREAAAREESFRSQRDEDLRRNAERQTQIAAIERIENDRRAEEARRSVDQQNRDDDERRRNDNSDRLAAIQRIDDDRRQSTDAAIRDANRQAEVDRQSALSRTDGDRGADRSRIEAVEAIKREEHDREERTRQARDQDPRSQDEERTRIERIEAIKRQERDHEERTRQDGELEHQHTEHARYADKIDRDIFAELKEELCLAAPSIRDRIPRFVDGVEQAIAAGWVGPAGRPLLVDLAVQEHRDSGKTRDAFDLSGRANESAHLAASSFFKDGVLSSSGESATAKYDRKGALTVILPRDIHSALDQHWKDWAYRQLKDGKDTCTVSEMRHQLHTRASGRRTGSRSIQEKIGLASAASGRLTRFARWRNVSS